MVQEVTTKSWGSRLVGAFWGMLIGLALIIGSFYLVFWNEGNGLHTAQSLQQTLQILLIVPNSPLDPKNDLKVVYFSGHATTNDILKDPLMGVSDKAIKLHRHVEMYQWKQEEETKTEKQLGGSEQEVKTYTYQPVWSEDVIDSSQFKDPKGHQNPASMPIESLEKQAETVTVGDFKLPKQLVSEISDAEPVDLSSVNLTNLQDKLKKPILHDGNGVYVGENPQIPVIGDLRIRIDKVLPQDVSVIAQQTGKSLQPFMAPSGKPVALLVLGLESPEQMIHEAEVENQLLTWMFRVLSLIMMMVGIALLFAPIVVLADVVPFFGSIVGLGTGFISCVAGFILWSVATAIAWFVVRPVWSISLIVLVIVLCFVMVIVRKRHKEIKYER